MINIHADTIALYNYMTSGAAAPSRSNKVKEIYFLMGGFLHYFLKFLVFFSDRNYGFQVLVFIFETLTEEITVQIMFYLLECP